ncbi:MAG: hypothetical protein JNK82_25605, partial [Myxococcaceae bacterium]|nr:hypothetical protein [Myxococcaceae bacterium]
MRRLTCLVLAAGLLAFAACRKPKPSPAYTEASGTYTTLLARLGDDAYFDDEMTRIEGLLASVPANSSDAQADGDEKEDSHKGPQRAAPDSSDRQHA